MTIKKFIPTLNKTNSILFSKEFRQDYLDFKNNSILFEQPILVTDLLFQIVSDLRNNIFYNDIFRGKDNQMRLDMWNDEFVSNESIELSKIYNISMFLKNRSKNQMTDALQFLKLFKNEKYSFVNNKGQTITTSGGLIKDWFFAEKSGNFEIKISLYWANKIVSLMEYNTLFIDAIKELSTNKQRLFLLWLLEVGDKGTKVNFDTLKEVFKLNYKKNNDVFRYFLLPIKTKLDAMNNGVSFNFKVNDNNNNQIIFIPYTVKPKSQDADLNMINYKLKYIKRQHKLSVENTAIIKKLIQTDYNLFIYNYKEFIKFIKQTNKKRATDFIDNDFVNNFNLMFY